MISQTKRLATFLVFMLLVSVVGRTFAFDWRNTEHGKLDANFSIKSAVAAPALKVYAAQSLPISVSFVGTNGTQAITTTTSFTDPTTKIGLNGTSPRYGVWIFSSYFIGWSDNPNYEIQGTGNLFYESAPISDFLAVNESQNPTLYAIYSSPFTLANVTILTGTRINDEVTADDFVTPGTPEKTDDLTVANYNASDGDYKIKTLDAVFKMNPFVAAAIYKDPWVGALDNGSTWGDLGRKKGNVTVVDLHLKIDKRVILPDEFDISFTGYVFRPISVRSAIKADGTPVQDNEIYPYLGVDQPGDPAGYGVLSRIQPNQPTTSFRAKSYLIDDGGNKVPIHDFVIRTRVRTGYDTYGNKITPITMDQIRSDMILSLSSDSFFTVPNDVAKQIAEDKANPIEFNGFVDGLIKGMYFGPVNSEIELLDFLLSEETIELEGSKIWNDNQNEMRPAGITISLMKNGQEIDSKTVTPDDTGNWVWRFTDLPKFENDEPITYMVAETNVPTGYMASAPCEIISTSENLTCTITNSRPGTLTIIKDAIPNSSSAEFQFTIVPEVDETEAFTLKDDGETENQKSFAIVPDQEYAISEGELPIGWALENIDCKLLEEGDTTDVINEDFWQKDLEKRVLRITLGANQAATCTFSNITEGKGTIKVIKKTYPETTGTAFNFALNSDGGEVKTFALKNNETLEISADPGSFSISETIPAGWFLLDADCMSTISGKNPKPDQFVLESGETISCTFHNAMPNTIAIKKTTNPRGDSQKFIFVSPDTTGLAGDFYDGSLRALSGGDLKPGTYRLQEMPLPNWKVASIKCVEQGANAVQNSSGDPATRWATIQYESGEVILCTFINEKIDPNLPDTGFPVTDDSEELPDTGFAVGHLTTLAEQPNNRLYSTTNMILKLPTLNVELPIVGVPETEDSWDVTWLNDQAGYLSGTAYPTWTGNTVLTAHVWTANNQPGPFVGIRHMKYGDPFTIEAFGKTYSYKVLQNQLIGASDFDKVMQHMEDDWVTLITCEDYNHSADRYSNRRMIRGTLVYIE